MLTRFQFKRSFQSRSDSESDSENETSDEVAQTEHCVKRLKLLVVLNSVLSLEGDSQLRNFSLRIGNVHRDRAQILRWVAELDEKMFSRQFRLCRTDFFYVLVKISDDLSKNTKNAICSSGSQITPELMLLITLRILAGASYLDMIHYRVHIDSVASIVWRTVQSVHKRIDNIKLASNEEECMKRAKYWAAIQLARWGQHLTVGTLYVPINRCPWDDSLILNIIFTNVQLELFVQIDAAK
jgi:hypothetical protein